MKAIITRVKGGELRACKENESLIVRIKGYNAEKEIELYLNKKGYTEIIYKK